MKVSQFEPLIKYCIQNDINPETALRIIKQANESNSTNFRSKWKLMKFTLYIWASLKAWERREQISRKDLVHEVVRTKEYFNLWNTFKQRSSFNADQEAKTLTQLIAEPRQDLVFKSKNFVFPKNHPKANKPIPQDLLDKLR